MKMRQKFIVKVYDMNGNLILETEEVQAKVRASTITLAGDEFVKNEIVEIIATAQNAIAGEPPENVAPEENEGGEG